MVNLEMQAQRVALDVLSGLDPDKTYEVIDGDLIEMTAAGLLHQFIARNVFRKLDPFVASNVLGEVFQDGLTFYLDVEQLIIKGSQVPDVSFIRKGRIPVDWDIERPFPGAPDLAVEVVSPGDDAELLNVRVERYLQFGTEQVWVFHPRQKQIHVFSRNDPDTMKIYRVGQTLIAESLFPGLVLKIADLFVVPSFIEK